MNDDGCIVVRYALVDQNDILPRFNSVFSRQMDSDLKYIVLTFVLHHLNLRRL